MNGYIYENSNSRAFYTLAWVAFGVSFLGMVVGLVYLDVDFATKGFLAMTYFFTITSCVTLSKVVRDRHESEKFLSKLESAKTEKFLNENSPIVT
ncbi:MAG: YiaA/YiaB family inner membrane protein [Bacteroidota bacterium]